MLFGRIPDGDHLFRATVHPNAYKIKKQSDQFVTSKAFKLEATPNDPAAFIGSLVWGRLAPTDVHVHDYGCRLAAKMNVNAKNQGRSTQYVYCGSFQVEARAIRQLPRAHNLNEVISASISHFPEDGEVAHAELKVTFDLNLVKGIEGSKTAVLIHLWNSCRGPMVHKCNCDFALNPHPSTTLVEPPKGAYKDLRSDFRKRLDLVRFRICERIVRRVQAICLSLRGT
jgi:hypothetical protein